MSVGKRKAFCLSCGWRGERTTPNRNKPCPHCKTNRVVRAGDLDMPVPRDPKVIARALNADPSLLWQVLREVRDLKIAGPWIPFDGQTYFERIANDGSRAAFVRIELGVFHWETVNHSGFAPRVEDAMDQADEALAGENIHWRLVK